MATEIKQENSNGQSNGRLLFNIHEAASMLGLAPITIRRLVARDHLHRQPHVRKLLFSRDELQRFATAL